MPGWCRSSCNQSRCVARPIRTASRDMSGLRATGRERGFALLVVLWTLVLIAFLIARLTAASTTETRVAANLAANAAAEAAADGAIYQAVFQLSAAQAQD